MPDSVEQLRLALAGRYAVDRELGRGGNAVVYLARDIKHDRQVAIKVLLPELAQSVRTERFLREIQIAAHLTHPHILPVYDSGAASDYLFYVMPYVEGESLRHRLEREKRLSIDQALQIAREVADALSYAHRQDVVHRDIKPENILFQEGHAVVADFGIARALTEASAQAVTATGIAVGTPVYMSPEQGAGSRTLDARSDVYSLACVVYEMLAGRPPFTGETPQEILAHHVLDPVPWLRKLRAEVPPGVETALLKALEKQPAERFATPTEFADALTSAPGLAARWRSRTRRTPVRRAVSVLASVVVLAAIAAGALRWRDAHTVPSVAVLPFVNLSGDTANEYVSDGMTEELINALVQVQGLRVPARTSAFAFKGKNLDIRDIGRRLGVATVLEGSVREERSAVRITAQLIKVTDGYLLWSQEYDRDRQGLLAVQEEIARAIAGAVKVKLGPADVAALARRYTDNPEAHDLYLRGRYFWYKRTREGFTRAIAYFKQAIALDSGYALAYSGLADAFVLEGAYGHLPWREAYPNAKAAALHAIALDSGLAEAYVSLGRVRQNYDWDWPGAERAFRRGLALNPRYALGHSWYGLFLVWVMSVNGRGDEGARETRLALELDPVNPAFNVIHCGALMYGRRHYREAIEYCRRTVELLPEWPAGHATLGLAYLYDGRESQALAEFETARQKDPTSLWYIADAGYVDARIGRRAEALALLRDVQSRAGGLDFWPAQAALYAGLDDRDRTLAALDSAVVNHAWAALSVGGPNLGDPLWDGVRSDPRFARILKQAKLGS